MPSKGTVVLDKHERNVVGRLRPDGKLEIDHGHMGLWTEEEGGCIGNSPATKLPPRGTAITRYIDLVHPASLYSSSNGEIPVDFSMKT